MHFRVATNDNRVGVAQAEQVISKLESLGHSCELIKIQNAGASKIKSHFYGEEKVLVQKLQDTVLKNKADIAVYAMKDVIYNQTDISDKVIFPAVLKRESHREVVITRDGEDFLTLKEGAKIGVSSERKSSQLKTSFPYLEMEFISGNTDNKLAKLEEGKVDGIVLSEADTLLLNMQNKVGVVFESDVIMPAFGQGIIGVLCKKDNEEVVNEISKLNDENTKDCFEVEKSVVEYLKVGGQAPVAGYCEYSLGGSLRVVGLVSSKDGKTVIRARKKEKNVSPKILGQHFAEDLQEQGATKLIKKGSI